VVCNEERTDPCIANVDGTVKMHEVPLNFQTGLSVNDVILVRSKGTQIRGTILWNCSVKLITVSLYSGNFPKTDKCTDHPQHVKT